MPIKDPQERREYQARLMRERRSKEKRGEIVAPCPSRGKRRKPAPLAAELPQALALSQEAKAFDPHLWEQNKCALGWAMVRQAQEILSHVDWTANDALKLITVGSELIESSLATIRAEEGEAEIDHQALLQSSELFVLQDLLARYATAQPVIEVSNEQEVAQ